MDLEWALDQFDRTQTNLERLQRVWARMQELVPAGISFADSSPDALMYNDLTHSFYEIAASLPSLEGRGLDAEIIGLDEIAKQRYDADLLDDEPDILIPLAERMVQPDHAIADYRRRLTTKRRQLVRDRVLELVAEIDALLAGLSPRYEADGRSVAEDPQWIELRERIREIDRLTSQDVPRKGRWGEMTRHLNFAKGVDLSDINEHDWPSVKKSIEGLLYSEVEPIPLEVTDLDKLVAAKPTGPVTTALNWQALDAAEFERLIFNLISDASGYENARWMMQTTAPDRGRDLSVDRTITDALSGVVRRRVIIQCKHWLSKSINLAECVTASNQVLAWQPPRVDALIIATSGRFTQDAVQWVERHNAEGKQPEIELWAESHLETLLAPRPALVTEFGLRRHTS